MTTKLLTTLHLPPLPLLICAFLISLVITMGASAWFTRCLENVSTRFDLSPSLLSLLGALGANIPNYVASLIAIAGGHLTTGLGIIVGSNIYNIAIILSVSTIATPASHGIILPRYIIRDVSQVALHTLGIMCTIFLLFWSLSAGQNNKNGNISPFLFSTIFCLLSFFIFLALAWHALQRKAHLHDEGSLEESHGGTQALPSVGKQTARPHSTFVMLVEIGLALGIALCGVIVMVNTGQDAASIMHLPNILLGLIVLAVATSLPNTVVAFSLARAHRAATCVEEVFSSNSINAVLGIGLPLLFWHQLLHDPLLLWLDTPLMILLTVSAWLCVLRQRISQPVAGLLFLVYIVWIVMHIYL